MGDDARLRFGDITQVSNPSVEHHVRAPLPLRRASPAGVGHAARRAGRRRSAPRRGRPRRVAAEPARHRLVRERGGAADSRRQCVVHAAIRAVVGRHGQAPLAVAAARQRHRCEPARCLGLSGRHPAVEGVRLRRAAGRDALYRARRRGLALRHLCVERRRQRCRARAAPRHRGPAGRRGAAGPLRHPEPGRLPGLPRWHHGAGARRERAAVVAPTAIRWRRTASRPARPTST